MAITARQDFVAVGVNRVVNALDWGENDLVAYGGHHAVVIYDPKLAAVIGTLVGHTGHVNCVKWVKSTVSQLVHDAAILVSGAADSTIKVWAWHPQINSSPWSLVASLEAHAGSVTDIDLLQQPDGSILMASTAGDADMRIWRWQPPTAAAAPAEPAQDAAGAVHLFAAEHWQLQQALHVGTKIQHSVALAALPHDPSCVLLASGGTDSVVRLYCQAPGAAAFQLASKLAGHENWIRGLAFTAVRDGGKVSLLLASASQDRYLRLWHVQQEQQQAAAAAAAAAADGSSCNGSSAMDSLAQMITKYAPKPTFQAGNVSYMATLESLLIGHEDWVHSVHWQPQPQQQQQQQQQQQHHQQQQQQEDVPERSSLVLLSSSMDRSMILWRCDRATGLWLNVASVGDAGAQCLGYFGGVFSPGAQYIMAHGFTGALHLWRHDAGSCTPVHALGGHFGSVEDICWGVDGRCLHSASTDQTARIFTGFGGHWCEVARSQVHGHDFSCIASIPTPHVSSPLYVSGSEEKVLRVMEAPLAFQDTLAAARGQGPSAAQQPRQGRALGAAIAALGLSNKAVYESGAEGAGGAGGASGAAGGYTEGPDFVPCAAPAAVTGPPLEEHLGQNTLWPEVTKLYGHGNDVYCVAASHDGRYLASACRAQSASWASIWIWATGEWRGVAQLQGHTLTVTQLAFSHDDRYLLSGSRDRTLCVFRRVAGGGAAGGDDGFELVGRVKAHSRIVWGVSWAADDSMFATCSRDHTVKLWGAPAEGQQQLGEQPLLVLPQFGAPVTAVAFAPALCDASGRCLLAVGLEDGSLQVWEVARADGQLVSGMVWGSREWCRHAAGVKRLCWRDAGVEEGCRCLQLASAGEDHAVRVMRLMV